MSVGDLVFTHRTKRILPARRALEAVESVLQMKLQYLGDSKDCFKWDYHHFLADALGAEQLQVVWMMTPDDGSTHGATPPDRFPARPEILALCRDLRTTRNPELLLTLPQLTGARYAMTFRDPASDSEPGSRGLEPALLESFDLCPAPRSVILLDPDNGFEPERNPTSRHLRYADLGALVGRLPESSLITVFQHFRRRAFTADLARIRERLHGGHSTALYWQSVMFVAIASSSARIDEVRFINQQYASVRPASVIA